MGVVHRAFDHSLGREVALKTLRAEDPNLLYSLKEEFRAAASIVHPNLVELYELFVHGPECFFTMELLDAVPFTRSVRQRGSSVRGMFDSIACSGVDTREALTKSGTLRIERRSDAVLPEGTSSVGAAARLAAGASQLAAAVAALHDAGRVHCDLKPSNILVTGAGRLVVLDFGLSAPLLGQLARQGFSGTLSYAAPEQLWGGELTAATDWYSVGVVLYEALTGELPPGESQLREMLERTWSALDPELKGLLPPHFAELLLGLLHLDPLERPSRHAIVSTLVRTRPGWSTPPPHERQFVGRSSELAVLQRALASTRDGWTTAVAVHGESGMGKTELIREFALQAAHADALVVRGQCRLDESVAYQALDQVIDELSKHLALLPRSERNTLLPDDFGSLVRVFPVLGRLGRAATTEDVDATILRQRAIVALRQLLWRLCAWRPLVVWIDDAHWGDAESQSLLCDLMQPPAPPVLLVMSHRAGAGTWLRPLADAVEQSQGQWLDLPVAPLDGHASAELVGALLGPLAREQPLLARRVAVESGRVPLFIGQLCRLIGETTRPEDARERLTLTEVIDRRVSALANDEQRVAELVALIEAPLPPSVVAEAAGLPAERSEVVSRLVAAQLLRLTGARAAPKLTSFHQRVRETILSRLDPTSRKRHHGLLAAALERLEPGVDPEILLHHWLGADERERALSAALRAADAATEKLAFSHAAALYRTAFGLLDRSSPERRGVQEKLAHALSAAGRAVEAGEQYFALAAGATGPDSLRWTQRAAENFLVGGSLDKGMDVLGGALRLVQLPEPPSTARAVTTGLARVVLFRLSRARTQPRERDAHAALRTDLCLSAAKGLGVVDPMLSAYFAFSSLEIAARSGDLSRTASALCLSGSILAFFRGRLGRWGEEWLAEAQEIADASQDGLLRGRVSVCQGQVDLNRGLWSTALARCDAATRWLERHPDAATWERNMADVIAIRALEELGELKQAWQRAADWRSDAQNRGDLYAETTANLYLAFAKLAADDADQAEHVATLALSKWSAEPPPFHEFYRLRVMAYAQLYRGRPDVALITLEEAERTLRAARLDSFPTSVLEVCLLRARIYLSLAREGQDTSGTLARCERDLDRLERIGRDDASAHASLLRAAVAATRGQRDTAFELLGSARTSFARRQMALGLTYVAAAEDALDGHAESARQLAAEASLRRQGIIQPRAWLALHAPGFGEWKRAVPS